MCPTLEGGLLPPITPLTRRGGYTPSSFSNLPGDLALSGLRIGLCSPLRPRRVGVHATIKQLQERHGENDLSVIAIEPAGERLVRFAAW
jgi:hypothetical protein